MAVGRWIRWVSGRSVWLIVFILLVFAIYTKLSPQSHVVIMHQEPFMISKQSRNTTVPWYPVPPVDFINRPVMYYKKGLELYLYTAFLDNRFDRTVIRILGVQHQYKLNVTFRCFWGQSGSSPDGKGLTEAPVSKFWLDKAWPWWGYYYAISLDCYLPLEAEPDVVDLHVEGINDTNLNAKFTLGIEKIQVRENRKLLGVCVKPLTDELSVARLVEWIELLQILGVDDISIYVADVRGPAQYVLEYYKGIGLISVNYFPAVESILKAADFTKLLPADRYAFYQQLFLLGLNDCLMRFRGEYRYIAVIDIDEVFIPTHNISLHEMMEQLIEYKDAACYTFNCAWHFEEFLPEPNVPYYLYTMQYLTSTVPLGVQPKSIVHSDRAISVNFHAMVDAPGDTDVYKRLFVPWNQFGAVHHYRGKCGGKFESMDCKLHLSQVSYDHVMERYHAELDRRVLRVLKHLQLL